MLKYPILVTDSSDHEFAKNIGDSLNAFNHEVTQINHQRPLAVVVRAPETEEILGGAIGRSSLGLLFRDLFYLPEALRGSGLSTQILSEFEA